MIELPTDYQKFIHASRYARFRDDLGRRETWNETVDRYFDYFVGSLEEKHGYKAPATLVSELKDAVLGLNVMPSMRALMTAGEAARRENLAIYNCSYVPIDSIRAFGETLYILMCGTGVGFSVERQVIKGLPDVPNDFVKVDTTIVVRDSKRGWAEAYETFVEGLFRGEICKMDYSEVRPKGSRLIVFGGRASGPEPLAELVEFTTHVFMLAKGRKLKSSELHEIICKIGSIVVVGGVRRAALISLSNLSDLRMRDVKSGDWYNTKPHLGLANNSAAYTEKPEPEIFMEEWLALYKSKSGERGIFNRHAAIRKLEHSGRRDPGFEFGTNPCVTGDTMIPTRKGWFPIQSLVGEEVEIWNGVTWSKISPYSTGENMTYEVVFSDGTVIKATDYHGWAIHNYEGVEGQLRNHPTPKRGSKFYKKVLTKDLRPGMALSKFDIFPELEPNERDPEVDAYSQGFYSGDGVTGAVRSRVYEPKYAVIGNLVGEVKEPLPEYNCRDWIHGPMLEKDYVPLNASKAYRLRWLAGLIDSDGCAVLTPEGSDTIQITAKNRDFLVNVRRLILSLGSHSHLGLPSEGGWGYIGEDNGTRSYFHPTSRLTISPYETQNLLRQGLETTRVTLSTREVGSPKRRFVTVVSVTPYSEEETFCYTEAEFGLGMFEGLVGPQCGEIILRPRGLCNLTEAVVRGNDSPADLKEKIRLASILGTWQATQTEFKFVRPEWKINAEEERLLGVSLTGIYANAFMRGDEQPELLNQELRAMKATAIAANGKEARSIGIPVAAGVTTIKPSGTVSKLVNTPAGIHHGHAQFFINRISQDVKDPITKFLIDSGVPHEPHYAEPDNMVVFAFPMKLEADVKTREQDTALGHAELVKTYNLHWSEHAVSCTVNIREGEWPAVGGWVYDNFHELTGMSFLPYFEGDSVYKQKPLETIDELTYHRLVAEMPQLDWSKLGEYEAGEDHVTGTQELACVGGVCDITAVGLG